MKNTFTRTPWTSEVIRNLRLHFSSDEVWSKRIDDISSRPSSHGLHLAVFVEPYLQYVLDGKKTVESRFGIHRRPPFGHVREGDILLLKRSGGPVTGICLVGQVWFYELDPKSWRKIKQEFSISLCAQDPDFWHQRRAASFATLMLIKDVRAVTPFDIPKKDRRGWVMLKDSAPTQELLFA
jgi:hypothetical protein